MFVYSILFITVSVLITQHAYCQCLNRGLPGCGPTLVENIVPNQVLIREPGLPLLPNVPAAPIYPGPILPAVQEIGYAPTIIQDSSVANSLANALQLLVVSNLLSSTLPGPCDAYPVEYLGMPAYPAVNYIY